MAKIEDVFLSGKFENMVFYYRNGKRIVRAIPHKVEQTEPTKKCSNNFGKTSTDGRTLRAQLLPALHFPKDKNMQSLFSGAIFSWVKQSDLKKIPPVDNIPFVNHFNFTKKAAISARLKLPITVIQTSADNIEIHIPAFIPVISVSAPVNTTLVELTIATGSCKLSDGENLGNDSVTISIPYNNTRIEAQVIPFHLSTKRGSLVITAAAMSYTLSNGKKEKRLAFMPSSVIDARLF